MGYTTVRITENAHRTLKGLARADGRSMQALLDDAIETLRRKRFLEQTNQAFAALRKDAAAWTALESERKEWDTTLEDGLAVHERGPSYGVRRRTATRRGKR
jgi:predicted transcriptional regulator